MSILYLPSQEEYVPRQSYHTATLALPKYPSIFWTDTNLKKERVSQKTMGKECSSDEVASVGATSRNSARIWTPSLLENVVDGVGVVLSVAGIGYAFNQMIHNTENSYVPLFGAVGGVLILGEIFIGRAYDNYLRNNKKSC